MQITKTVILVTSATDLSKWSKSIKHILLITNEIFNDKKISNAVRIASNRNPKADHNDLVKAAYNHLKRHRSDAWYLSII